MLGSPWILCREVLNNIFLLKKNKENCYCSNIFRLFMQEKYQKE